jgi:hypothetical protein
MIVFRGWGILVVIIGFLCFAATAAAVYAATGDNHYFEDHRWPTLAGCLLTAAVIWPVGRWFNRAARTAPLGEDVRDEQLARLALSRHTLFFVPMEYWTIILVFAGVVISLKP